MEAIEAKILLKNLLKRVRKLDDGNYELLGVLTDSEFDAIHLALSLIDASSALPRAENSPESTSTVNVSPGEQVSPSKIIPPDDMTPVSSPPAEIDKANIEPVSAVELDVSSLDLDAAKTWLRLCMDFGTAMSKATLVKDETAERDYEDIEVLKLGVPGDQEEISETMLISSVFIDREGILWFGKMAVEHSHLEAQDGGRQRLDNIKRYLSEEGLDEPVGKQFNPTSANITYGDMVLAYLMYLTWAVNKSLEDEKLPHNINRRFAMPCFDSGKSRDTSQRLRTMLGKAQVLADTFFSSLQDGIPLVDFMEAVSQLRRIKSDYDFVLEGITEPLGVAGSLISWKENVNMLLMVIDVGAGTSDFSLYRMVYNPATSKSAALEIADTARGITEAGNHLDQLLKGLILKKAGVDSSHPHWINIMWALELNLRDYKEALFRDEFVSIQLFNGEVVEVVLEKFLELAQVMAFGVSLKACMLDILENIDDSFIKGAPKNALAVSLTGGGAELPMVKDLVQGMLNVNGTDIQLVQTAHFPVWLRDDYPELERDYSRIAVSLGGARKHIIESKGVARMTAGDVKVTPTLGGYYS